MLSRVLAAAALLLAGGAHAADLRGAVPPGGCVNEGDFKTGNHCVYMEGQALEQFMQNTQQDFEENGQRATKWCVCLHLYESNGNTGGDTSACSEGAMKAAQ